MSKHSDETFSSERFKFGENWTRFLAYLTEERIRDAEKSLKSMLGLDSLKGKKFLDIGSGSGLFSLAAKRMGAVVHSFDYDPQSVACTRELRRRYFSEDKDWVVEENSVLDVDYLQQLGQFDIVYSWGVLHHTGAMWEALENVVIPTKTDGLLFIAIYNDQGWISSYWKIVKKIFISNFIGRFATVTIHLPYLLGARLIFRLLTGRLHLERGMTYWYDMLDWLGGWPFEVSTAEKLSDFYQRRGFKVVRTMTCGRRNGCNEFVFRRIPNINE